MAMFTAGEGEGDSAADENMKFLSPTHIDHQIRGAIQFCWMMTPKERRTVDEVESQIRRLVDRALRDFREDAAAFGKTLEEE